MVLKIVLIIVGIILIVYILNFIESKRVNKSTRVSFMESMNLTDLPIITFFQGDKKFNFLLDTGSNLSHISKSASENIEGTFSKESYNKTFTAGGAASITTQECETKLTYKNRVYDITLCIGNHLDDVFAGLKADTGVQVHGIIGNSFMQKYKYVIDFDELVAYQK